jgi:peptidyl-prolyl cis-trans isomerase A (cyclophilin A)
MNINLKNNFFQRMCRLLGIAAIIFLISCGHTKYKDPHVMIYTTMGDIELELYPDKAPKTVAAFLSYVDAGYYTNSSFYRVLKTEELPASFNPGIIQGGINQTTLDQHPNIPGIPHESTKQTGLSHTNGTISLARLAAGTASTEFFICIDDQTNFDYGNTSSGDGLGYAAFGKVLHGMSVVKDIQNERSHGDRFDKMITIKKIERL